MLYAFNVFIIVLIAVCFIGLTKRRFEEVLPLSIFMIILILYIFSLFAKVNIGIYIVTTISVLVFVFTIVYSGFHRKFKDLLYNLFTPGFLVFVLLVILVGYITDGRLLSKWDEFTNWGLQLKNMFIFNGLANVQGVTTIGTGYPPATTVFEYFFAGFRNNLVEGDMFRAMGIFTIALILPIFKKVTWKKWPIGLTIFPIVFLLPTIFSKDVEILNTLYVDALMGLLMAFILYSYFSEKFSKFSFIMVGLGASVLTLVKSSGFPLALSMLIVISFDIIVFKQKEIREFLRNKINLLVFILSVIIGFFGKISWSIFVKLTSLNEVWSYIGLEPTKTETRIKIFNNFIKAFFSGKYGSVEGVSAFMWILICGVLVAFIGLKLRKRKKIIRVSVDFILIVLGFLAYSASLLLMYMFLFLEYEGLNLSSFSRYIDTYILAMIMFLIYILIDLTHEIKKTAAMTILFCILAIVLLVTPIEYVLNNTLYSKKNIEENIEKRLPYIKSTKFADLIDYKDNRVYFICQESKGRDYAISYYNSTPVMMGYDYYMGWSLGEPYYDEDIWTLDFSLEKWENILKESYTYVYIYKADQKFIERYGSLFENGVENDTLYIINIVNDHVVLRKKL